MNAAPCVRHVTAQFLFSRTLHYEAVRSQDTLVLSRERSDSRRAPGRRTCEEFSFVDAVGLSKFAGCLKALAALAEGSPEIRLPPPLVSVVISATDKPALGHTLVATNEHTHRMTTLAGGQVRHPVGSAHGWVRQGFPPRRSGYRRGTAGLRGARSSAGVILPAWFV